MQKPGLGQRLAERIKAIKAGIYRDDDAKFGIKVTEFALDHRYAPGSVFKWVGDVVVPDYETILKLARDLDASPGWLHYGDEELHGHGPSRGKVQRRQGRRTAGSLLIACMAGAGSLLGFGPPSGGGAAAAAALPGVQVVEKISLIRLWLRNMRPRWARPVQSLGCPA